MGKGVVNRFGSAPPDWAGPYRCLRCLEGCEKVGSPLQTAREPDAIRRAMGLAPALLDDYIGTMCGRVIQSSGPLRYAIVDGMNVRDSRVHNYPHRWKAEPSNEMVRI